jgi:hypothetical protein
VSDPSAPSLFDSLDASGRFHRDTPLGRIFHPGAVSFREIAETDSLHVSVLPGNRISVHVDRVSPLAVDHGGRCRYSLLRALVHNLAVVADVLRGVARRRQVDHRCHLDCELVWVPDDEPVDHPASDGAPGDWVLGDCVPYDGVERAPRAS